MIEKNGNIIKQVKSRLLPLSPAVQCFERLVELLPRRFLKLGLKPNQDIVTISESEGHYEAVGDNPCFDLVIDPCQNLGGWYYLEAALVRNNGNREACLQVDTGNESNTTMTISIPTNLRGSVREVFYLPQSFMSLRWIPTKASGYFSQSLLVLHRISLLESYLRRIYRVFFDLWRFKDRTLAARAGLTLAGALRDVQEAYQCTVLLRSMRLARNDYAAFIAFNDTPTKSDLRYIRNRIRKMPFYPCISLIMLIQQPVLFLFREALDSILSQSYPYWELLLTGDLPALASIRDVLPEDTRIKSVPTCSTDESVVFLNCALEAATGLFVVRIGQHDMLSRHALFYLANEHCCFPDADLIYTDEDSIDERGLRCDPHFKPDWNPDMLFSCDYIGNLRAFLRTRLIELGGYRQGYLGAEDYELTLRYAQNTEAGGFRHVSKVLYHQRIHLTPMATAIPENLLDCHQAGMRALRDRLHGSYIEVIDGPELCFYRVLYPLPDSPPLTSIIIPTRDKVDILKKCVESIRQKTDYSNWEMLIVDNQSVDPATHRYFQDIQCDSRIRVIEYPKEFNFSAMNNFAVLEARGEVLTLLNNDVTVISRQWLTEMVSHAVRPEIGAVGSKLLYPDGTVQHAGVIIGLGGVAGHAHKYLEGDASGYCHRARIVQNLSAVTGACLVVRKAAYQQIGGLNEDLAVAFNDIDFCLRLREAGLRNIFTPYAMLYHHESISRGQNDTLEKHELFMREFMYMKEKWREKLRCDPAYNLNLSLELEAFSYDTRLRSAKTWTLKYQIHSKTEVEH